MRIQVKAQNMMAAKDYPLLMSLSCIVDLTLM